MKQKRKSQVSRLGDALSPRGTGWATPLGGAVPLLKINLEPKEQKLKAFLPHYQSSDVQRFTKISRV